MGDYLDAPARLPGVFLFGESREVWEVHQFLRLVQTARLKKSKARKETQGTALSEARRYLSKWPFFARRFIVPAATSTICCAVPDTDASLFCCLRWRLIILPPAPTLGRLFFPSPAPATPFSVSCARDLLFGLLRRRPGFPSPRPATRYSATSAGGSSFSAGDSFCRCSHRRPTSPLPAPRTHHSIFSANSELIRHRR